MRAWKARERMVRMTSGDCRYFHPDAHDASGGASIGVDIDSPAACARLERLFEEQAGLCERLWELAQRQGELVASQQSDAVLGVLAERQVLVDAVVGLSSQLEPFRRSWDRVRAGLDADRRERIRKLTDRIDDLLGQIDARDRADGELLSQRRATATEGLTTVRQGRGALSAYSSGSGGSSPRYQDRQA